MSSIIGSKNSSNRQNDELRDVRKSYQKKIDELIKRQNLEIAALNRRHERELAKIEQSNEKNVDHIREQHQDSITRRDLAYQNAVDSLRKMHARQMEKLMAENQAKLDRARHVSSEDLRLTKENKDSRVEDLERQLEAQNEERNQRFTDDLDQVRHDERADVNRIRNALNQQHEKELKELRESRDQQVGRLDSENREMYQVDHQQLRDQERRFESDKARTEDAHMNNILMRDEAHKESLAHARQGFNEDLHDIRRRYAKQRERDLQEQGGIDQKFHDRVEDRIGREINDLKLQLNRERNRDAENELAAETKAKREISNMGDEYQTKLDYLENARRQAIADDNDINASKIRKIHRMYDQEMASNSRQLQGQMNMDNEINREALEDAKQQNSLREKYEHDFANTRVDKIRKNEQGQEKLLRDNYDKNVQVQKDAYEDKKRDLVYGLTKSKADALRAIQARAEKQEMENQEQVGDLQAKYKERIEALNQQLVRERREHNVHDQRLVKEMKREENEELDAQKIKYEEKARIAEMDHEREVKEMSRRNQEKLDQLLSTVKNEKA